MDREYLTTYQVAQLLGVQTKTVRQTLWRGAMPEPDMILFGRNLWLAETIERWKRARNKKGRKRKGRLRAEKLRPPKTRALPANTRIHHDGKAAPTDKPVRSAINPELAAAVAAQLRAEGHHCTARDAMELATIDPTGLSYERKKLQQRVARKVRGMKSRY